MSETAASKKCGSIVRRCRIPQRIVSALLACSDPDPDETVIAESLSAIRHSDRFLQCAHKHKLLPLVAWWAEHLDLWGSLASKLRIELVSQRDHARTVRSAQTIVMSQILDEFGRADIPVMVLKGPLMAHWLYDDPACRVSEDIDLLVPLAHRDRASEKLESAGYSPHWRQYYEQHHYHTLWVHDVRATVRAVELHWDVRPPYHPIDFSIDDWWLRSEQVPFLNGKARRPDLVDQAVHLSWHALVSGGTTLRDLSEVARAIQRIDSAKLLARCEAAGSQRFLAVAMRLIEQLWSAPSDPSLVAASPQGHRGRLAKKLYRADAVIDEDKSRWWPWGEIACWSLFAPEQAGFGYLVRGSMHQQRQTPWVREQGRPSSPRVLAELLFALAMLGVKRTPA